MSQKELLSIAFKVFSLWFLCELFLHLTAVIPLMLNTMSRWQGSDVPVWAYIIISLSFLAGGLIIYKLLFSISNSILENVTSDTKILSTDTGHKFILQICGLFFLISSLIWFPSSLTFLFNPETKVIPWFFYFKPMTYVLEFLIGLWLIIHPSWWELLLTKLRGRA